MAQARIYRGDAVSALGRDLLEEFPETIAPAEVESEEVEEAPIDLEALRMAVLEEARQDAERKVREAYDEGLRRGTEAGLSTFLERVGDAALVLEAAAESMQQARMEFLSSLEAEVVALARGIVERVLHRECADDGMMIARLARRALESLVDAEEIRLRLHPADKAVLEEQRIALLKEFPAVKLLRIEEDSTVERGGCIAETRGFEADFQPQALLDNLMEDIFP